MKLKIKTLKTGCKQMFFFFFLQPELLNAVEGNSQCLRPWLAPGNDIPTQTHYYFIFINFFSPSPFLFFLFLFSVSFYWWFFFLGFILNLIPCRKISGKPWNLFPWLLRTPFTPHSYYTLHNGVAYVAVRMWVLS